MRKRASIRRSATSAAVAALSLAGACGAGANNQAGREIAISAGAMAGPPNEMAMPNDQMQAVLNELQALRPRPIPRSTPEEARQQPTPADAARRRADIMKTDCAGYRVARLCTIPGRSVCCPSVLNTEQGADLPFFAITRWGGIADKDFSMPVRARSPRWRTRCAVVHYRQGPDHKFRTPHDA